MINLSYGHISKEFLDYEYIKEIIKSNLNNVDFSQYSTPGGNMYLRKKIANKYLSNKDISCCCTSVSTNLSFYILFNLFTKNNKIGIFTPLYLNYYKQISAEPKKIIFYSYEDLSKLKISYNELDRGDISIIVLPNNPTGQMISKEILEGNLVKMHKRGVSCIIDASWLFSVFFKDKKISINELSELVLKYNSILLLGFTKLFGVTSLRCSGVIASADIISKFIKRHDYLTVGCGAIDELLVYNFLDNKSPVNWRKVKKYLKEQSNMAINYLNRSNIEIKCYKPEAGIFLYFRCPKVQNADIIVENCKNNNLLIYSSSAFENRNDGFRLCYSKSVKEIREGINILLKTINENN